MSFGVDSLVPFFCTPVGTWFIFSFFSPWFYTRFMTFSGKLAHTGIYFFNFFGAFWFDILLYLACAFIASTNGTVSTGEVLSAVYGWYPNWKTQRTIKFVAWISHIYITRKYKSGWSNHVNYQRNLAIATKDGCVDC